MQLRKLIMFFSQLFLTTPVASAQIESKKWLNYEPTIASLAGIWVNEKNFGPPSYCENKSDPAAMIPILRLNILRKVKSKLHSQHSNEEIDTDFFENMRIIQLIYT